MKRFVTMIFAALLLLSCGNNKTPEQEAKECFDRQMKEMEAGQMKRERYIDSLVNVATGLDGATLRANRQHALDILRKEYPEMQERWDGVQRSIDNMETY